MNDITTLRNALFDQMAELRATDTSDPDKLKIAVHKAAAVSDLAKTITDTARVEVEYLRSTGGDESAFLGPVEGKPLPQGITGVVRHRLK